MNRKDLHQKKIIEFLYPIVTLAVIMLAWLIVAKAIDAEIIVPSIRETFISFFKLLIEKRTYILILGTLWRTLLTFIFGAVTGILFAILSATFPKFGKIFLSATRLLRAVPTISVILLIIVWLDSAIAPILVAFLIIFPIIYANIYDSINSIDAEILKMCQVYKINKKDIALKVYVPYVLPIFLDTAKSTVSLALKVVISAEVLAQTKNSIGIMMQINKARLETASLLAWTFFAVIISLLLEAIIEIIKKKIIRWQV